LRFLAEHPEAEDLKVTEIEVAYDPNATLRIRNYQDRREARGVCELTGWNSLQNFGEVYNFIHPPGTRTYRYLPLPLLLWAEEVAGEGRGLRPRFFPDLVSLDQVRSLLKRRARPVSLIVPLRRPAEIPGQGPREGRYGSMTIHEVTGDEQWAAIHDLYHLRRWDQWREPQGPMLRADVLAIEGSFQRLLQRVPLGLRGASMFHEASDQILSGPSAEGLGVYHQGFINLKYFLERDLPKELVRGFAAQFREQLQSDLSRNPRIHRMLEEFDEVFRR